MKIFYTGDLHIGDTEVIQRLNRPFVSHEDMVKKIIENWNSLVSTEDSVYILGDMFYPPVSDLEDILSTLKGKKYLIIGNHDKHWLTNRLKERFFVGCEQMVNIVDEGRWVTLCHYPMFDWYKAKYGAVQVYGHIHNERPEFFETLSKLNSANAGVDVNLFMPCLLETLFINKKNDLQC